MLLLMAETIWVYAVESGANTLMCQCWSGLVQWKSHLVGPTGSVTCGRDHSFHVFGGVHVKICTQF